MDFEAVRGKKGFATAFLIADKSVFPTMCLLVSAQVSSSAIGSWTALKSALISLNLWDINVAWLIFNCSWNPETMWWILMSKERKKVTNSLIIRLLNTSAVPRKEWHALESRLTLQNRKLTEKEKRAIYIYSNYMYIVKNQKLERIPKITSNQPTIPIQSTSVAYSRAIYCRERQGRIYFHKLTLKGTSLCAELTSWRNPQFLKVSFSVT